MKFYPRLGMYKAPNVTYNPETMEAYSYGWWKFVEKIGDILVFNDYRYSSTTQRHQSKVRRLLGYSTPMIEIECPKGLLKLESAIDYYRYRQNMLSDAINAPRSKAYKDLERAVEIESLERQIEVVKELIKIKEAG